MSAPVHLELIGSLKLLGFGWGWAQELGTKGQGLTILVKTAPTFRVDQLEFDFHSHPEHI